MFIVTPAWAGENDDDGDAVPQKGRHQRILEEYDTDKEGKLSAEEKEVARESMRRDGGQGEHRGKGGSNRQKMLERFDTDGDGELSPAERKTARAAMRTEGGSRGPGGRGGISRQKMLESFDTDGDGVI